MAPREQRAGERDLASSARGVGAWMLSGARPPDEPERDRPLLDAVPASQERVRELVRDDRREEPEGDDAADRPLDGHRQVRRGELPPAGRRAASRSR